MIWLISLFLIIVACYLIMQGMAERDLFYSDADEPDAPDQDLFMRISDRMKPDVDEGDMTIADEDSKFAKAVQRFQEKSANASDRIEQKVAQSTDNPKESLFDRSLAKVSTMTENADKKLEQKVGAAKAQPAGTSIADDDSAIGRMVTKVNDTLKKSEDRLQAKVERSTAGDAIRVSEEDGFFGKMVSGVSSRLESIDQRLDDKLDAKRGVSSEGEALSSNEDFFSRVAGKIGDSVNNADDKIVDASRKLSRESKL